MYRQASFLFLFFAPLLFGKIIASSHSLQRLHNRGKEADFLNQKTLGIVSAPGLAETKSRNLKDILQESLEKEIPGETEWTVEVQVDRIVGSATLLKHIMDQTNRLKETNNWDGAIAVTDLPVFHKKLYDRSAI